MDTIRIALANLPFPQNRNHSISLAEEAINEAAVRRAALVCFPECYVPGYRLASKNVAPPDAAFLENAWARVAQAAAKAKIGVILGTERISGEALIACALVINPDGSLAGFQDKVQIDPSEESAYTPGTQRRMFEIAGMKFGIAICHEGWRYPETVRWAARQGAQVVFHPHFHEAEPGSYRATTFSEQANTFFEKAMLCRAAENNCYFASVNYASEGSPTTSAVIDPDARVLSYQPYGEAGLLVADLDPSKATRLYAMRCKAT